jgi:hypothetical protein
MAARFGLALTLDLGTALRLCPGRTRRRTVLFSAAAGRSADALSHPLRRSQTNASHQRNGPEQETLSHRVACHRKFLSGFPLWFVPGQAFRRHVDQRENRCSDDYVPLICAAIARCFSIRR